ncbi:hypothetical protein K1719_003857 [Acacia pycnantha]|nr:hypothetical protein K1719_003857 [Acacia pycnantha]
MKSLFAENTSLYHNTTPSLLVPNLPSLPLNNNGISSFTTINSLINLDQGDPVLFKEYWRKMSEEFAVVRKGYTNNKHIVVRNGSTQLFQAALYAPSSSSSSSSSDDPMNVVAAAPYYSIRSASLSLSLSYPKSFSSSSMFLVPPLLFL